MESNLTAEDEVGDIGNSLYKGRIYKTILENKDLMQ